MKVMMSFALIFLFISQWVEASPKEIVKHPEVTALIVDLSHPSNVVREEAIHSFRDLNLDTQTILPQLMEVAQLGAIPYTNGKDYGTGGCYMSGYSVPYQLSKAGAERALVVMGDRAVSPLIEFYETAIPYNQNIIKRVFLSMRHQNILSEKNEDLVRDFLLKNEDPKEEGANLRHRIGEEAPIHLDRLPRVSHLIVELSQAVDEKTRRNVAHAFRNENVDLDKAIPQLLEVIERGALAVPDSNQLDYRMADQSAFRGCLFGADRYAYWGMSPVVAHRFRADPLSNPYSHGMGGFYYWGGYGNGYDSYSSHPAFKPQAQRGFVYNSSSQSALGAKEAIAFMGDKAVRPLIRIYNRSESASKKDSIEAVFRAMLKEKTLSSEYRDMMIGWLETLR